jgi:hypothetical protein
LRALPQRPTAAWGSFRQHCIHALVETEPQLAPARRTVRQCLSFASQPETPRSVRLTAWPSGQSPQNFAIALTRDSAGRVSGAQISGSVLDRATQAQRAELEASLRQVADDLGVPPARPPLRQGTTFSETATITRSSGFSFENLTLQCQVAGASVRAARQVVVADCAGNGPGRYSNPPQNLRFAGSVDIRMRIAIDVETGLNSAMQFAMRMSGDFTRISDGVASRGGLRVSGVARLD